MLKGKNVWVVLYEDEEFFNLTKVCESKENAENAIKADFVKMSQVNADSTSIWKNIECVEDTNTYFIYKIDYVKDDGFLYFVYVYGELHTIQ